MKKLSYLLFVALLLNCSEKKSTPLTNENLVQVLTEYGKNNPEKEVVIETDFGVIRLRLYDDTPLHRANFVKLIKEGHYDEGDFYRVVNEFMIQGGDNDHQPSYTIPAEFTQHVHKRGALSMARGDNPEKRSSAAEFFIVHGSGYSAEDVDMEAQELGLTLTPEQKQIYISAGGYMSLDQQYTVFGEVTEGFDVVDKIARQKVHNVDHPLQKIPFKISAK